MSYDYGLDRDRRRVTVVMQESFALPDIFAVLNRLAADEGWGYSGLFDARSLTWTPSTSEIRQIVDHISRTSSRLETKPGPAALVAGSLATFGMGRMLAMLAESATGLNMNVFRDPANAERWLDEQMQPEV